MFAETKSDSDPVKQASSRPRALEYAGHPTPLSRIDAAVMAIKLVGIFCFAMGLPLIEVLVVAARLGNSIYTNAAVLKYATYLAAGIVVFLLSERLAPRLLSSKGGAGAVAPRGSELQSAAITITGIVLIAISLPSVALMALGIALSKPGGSEIGRLLVTHLLSYPVHVPQLALGLLLFLYGRGVIGVWHKTRTAGVPDAEKTSPEQ